MGNLFGGGTQKTSQTVNNQPWAPQQPFLMGGMEDALNAYNTVNNIGPYTGNVTAGPNSLQANAENFASGYTNGQGAGMPTVVNGVAGDLLSGAPNFVNNAVTMASNGIAGPNAGLEGTLQGYGTGALRTGGPSAPLSGALNNAAVNGANSLNTFNSGLQTAANTAMSDPTQRIAADAATYANNPGVQAAIGSTNAQLQQVLNENTIPGLNREAAMTGGLNGSRAGMAEGMAREGEGIAQGNADASILNNAYNTGTNTAANLYASGLQNAVNANTSGLFDVGLNTNNEANRQQGLNEFNTSTAVGAANSGLGTNLQYELGNANTQLGANAQLGTGVGLGTNAATTGGNLAAGNFGLGAQAGALQQAGQQDALTNALQQYEMQTSFPFQNVDNYWNVVGRPVGNTSTQSGTVQNSGPGVLGGVLGLGIGAGGLFGKNGAFPGVGNYIGGLFGG
jgi:hypothetical protein